MGRGLCFGYPNRSRLSFARQRALCARFWINEHPRYSWPATPSALVIVLPSRVSRGTLAGRGLRGGDMDEIKALAADLGWLSRYHKPQTLLYLATYEHACAGRIEPPDARAIYAAFAGRALASSGSDAVQVSKLRTMIRLADHPHSLKCRRVLMVVLAIMGASAQAGSVSNALSRVARAQLDRRKPFTTREIEALLQDR